MSIFRAVLSALAVIASVLFSSTVRADEASAERFGGSAQIGSQPAFPVHVELRRSGNAVSGVISIPIGKYELVEAVGENDISGRFRGEGGGGAVSLRIDGDGLTGNFNFAGQPGTIAARRTSQAADDFFKPPAQRLDLNQAQWLQDLDRLAEILMREHASPFHRISRDQLERDVAALRTAVPKLDGIAIALEFRKLAASIGDGHTFVALPSGRPLLPVEFYWFEDGLRVVAASTTYSEVLGAKLIAVNDVTAETLMERLTQFVPQGEAATYHRAKAAELLGNPDALRSLGLDGKLIFALQTFDVGQRRVEITPSAGTQSLAALGGKPPLWQQTRNSGFWSGQLSGDLVYVNWRSYDDLATHAAAFLKSIDARHPPRLVIDLRDNTGGNFNAGRAFIDELRTRPWLNRRGALYVLIGRRTFSAAMTNAVDFRQMTEAVLVGEPAGAAPNNWQEARRFNLPNSGLGVSVSTRFYEFLPGQKELLPDHQVSPDPSDWGGAEDAAIRFVRTLPDP